MLQSKQTTRAPPPASPGERVTQSDTNLHWTVNSARLWIVLFRALCACHTVWMVSNVNRMHEQTCLQLQGKKTLKVHREDRYESMG